MSRSLPSECDVLVAGSGNAGFCAAVAAAQAGAKRVLLIDKCPENWAGGNTYFTAGAYRTVHDGTRDLLSIVNNVDAATAAKIDMEPILVQDSNSAVKWLAKNGVRFQLSFNRQAYEVDGRFKFWGGLSLKTQDGRKGLVKDHQAAASRHGVAVIYNTGLKGLNQDANTGSVTSVTVHHAGKDRIIKVQSVILAAGGFEGNARIRSQYLGPGWDTAFVRGSPYNSGDALELAIRDVSAKQCGNWSGCHSVAWDANAPPNAGDREASNKFTKSGYPIGLMLNSEGERFVDEGLDLRNYTYAKFGRAILAQPNHIAFQVWDSRTIPWLRQEEYREERVQRITASSIEELADKCVAQGLQNRDKFCSTINNYNNAVRAHREENPNAKWDPAIRDSVSTQSRKSQLPLAKSNWALPVDKAPYLAVKVTCGITFTFGGLAVNPETTQVISAETNTEIPGLYCVGEMLGGLFHENYLGGSGLTSGAVFGRRARTAAARAVREKEQAIRSNL